MSFHRSNGSTGNGIGGKLDNFFEKKELPMYKDKPYNYASSKRRTQSTQRQRVLAGAVVTLLALLYWFGFFSKAPENRQTKGKGEGSWSWLGGSGSSVNWDSRREAVKEAFLLSWDGYAKYAWGKPPTT